MILRLIDSATGDFIEVNFQYKMKKISEKIFVCLIYLMVLDCIFHLGHVHKFKFLFKFRVRALVKQYPRV